MNRTRVRWKFPSSLERRRKGRQAWNTECCEFDFSSISQHIYFAVVSAFTVCVSVCAQRHFVIYNKFLCVSKNTIHFGIIKPPSYMFIMLSSMFKRMFSPCGVYMTFINLYVLYHMKLNVTYDKIKYYSNRLILRRPTGNRQKKKEENVTNVSECQDNEHGTKTWRKNTYTT